MWDSEQFSQVPLSCSQGSQNSSSDMFSQSKTSQIKGFNSFDVWSQPTNSQQISEVCNGGRNLTYKDKFIFPKIVFVHRFKAYVS